MQHDESGKTSGMGWGRFAGMIAVSTLVMFGLMYQLVYRAEHLEFSINRLVASLVMACVMAIVMLAFMWSMYQGRKAKIGVLVIAALAGIALLATNRSQALISDVSFMKSMIPHHSIAINNASKSELSDPRVRRLADEIIRSQVREIAEMQMLIEDIEQRGERGGSPLPPVPAVLTPEMRSRAREAVE